MIETLLKVGVGVSGDEGAVLFPRDLFHGLLRWKKGKILFIPSVVAAQATATHLD